MATKPKPKAKAKVTAEKLSVEQRKILFVEAYLSNGGNSTQAAIAAGYSVSGANKQGQRMSANVQILSMIRQRQDELAKKHNLTTDSLIAELSKIVHADLRNLFDESGAMKAVCDWPDSIAGAISAVEVDERLEGQGEDRKITTTKKLKLWDKNSAIEKAMKHLGMFKQDNDQKPAAVLLMADIAKNPASRIKIG